MRRAGIRVGRKRVERLTADQGSQGASCARTGAKAWLDRCGGAGVGDGHRAARPGGVRGAGGQCGRHITRQPHRNGQYPARPAALHLDMRCPVPQPPPRDGEQFPDRRPPGDHSGGVDLRRWRDPHLPGTHEQPPVPPVTDDPDHPAVTASGTQPASSHGQHAATASTSALTR
ncbi:hypothetical protein AB0K00_50295 [Dactylosporangium sp. NPDC049525]|uniref:hypothetical protein n=1 Tax=Dactylosporangium sp. NPDC049525 TaxID=3154730 RepID=UPI00341F645D